MREDPLGSDRYGRNFWAFVHDPARLWVETPGRSSGCGSDWAYFDTIALVDSVIGALDDKHADEAK